MLPAPVADRVLSDGVNDALFSSLALDFIAPLGELIRYRLRQVSKRETGAFLDRGVAKVIEALCEPRMEGGFPVIGVPFQVALLGRFPAFFGTIPGCVEDEAMRVQVRRGLSIDRPGSEVIELGPDHIPGHPVLVFAARADARFHFGFGVPERLPVALLESPQDSLVPRHLVKDGDRLWRGKRPVVPDPAVFLLAGR